MGDSAGSSEGSVSWLIRMLIFLGMISIRMVLYIIEYNVRICNDEKEEGGGES